MTWTNLTDEQLKVIGRWLAWAERHAMRCYAGRDKDQTMWVWHKELNDLAHYQDEIRTELEARRKSPAGTFEINVGTLTMNIGH